MFTDEKISAVIITTLIILSFKKTTFITRFLNEILSDAFSQDFFQNFEQTKNFYEHIPKSSSRFDQTKSENKFSVENNQQNNRTVQQNRVEKTSAKLNLFFYSNQEIKRILIKRHKTFKKKKLKFITPEKSSDEFSDEKSKRKKQKIKADKQKTKKLKSTPQKDVSNTLKKKNARIMTLICDHIFSYHAYIRR